MLSFTTFRSDKFESGRAPLRIYPIILELLLFVSFGFQCHWAAAEAPKWLLAHLALSGAHIDISVKPSTQILLIVENLAR